MNAPVSRPLPMSPENVTAILERRKWHTRRVVKRRDGERPLDFYDGMFWFADGDAFEMACPYGVPGDHLWIREPWAVARSLDVHNGADLATRPTLPEVWYKAEGPYPPDVGRPRAARFMPRWASRLALTITDVRAERLHAISEEDAKAEGPDGWCARGNLYWQGGTAFIDERAPTFDRARAIGGWRGDFAALWERVNGAGAWAENPMVWVIAFEILQGK